MEPNYVKKNTLKKGKGNKYDKKKNLEGETKIMSEKHWGKRNAYTKVRKMQISKIKVWQDKLKLK